MKSTHYNMMLKKHSSSNANPSITCCRYSLEHFIWLCMDHQQTDFPNSIHLENRYTPFFFHYVYFIRVAGWGRTYPYHSMHMEVREWLILLYFHPMTSRNQTQAFRLSGKNLNPLSPLTGPCTICFLKPTDTKSRILKITSYLYS